MTEAVGMKGTMITTVTVFKQECNMMHPENKCNFCDSTRAQDTKTPATGYEAGKSPGQPARMKQNDAILNFPNKLYANAVGMLHNHISSTCSGYLYDSYV